MSEDDEFREAIAGERRDARRGAKMFAEACAGDDIDAFLCAADFLNCHAYDGWRLGMMRVARLPGVNAVIQAAFLNIWIESNMLPLRVGDRPALARALRLLMPCDYRGPPMRLYGGANWQERVRHRYGFSWTQNPVIARGFAAARAWPPMAEQHHDAAAPSKFSAAFARETEGVVLGILAPAEAILLLREEEGYYDEGEVVVDPFKIGPVTVTERVRPSPFSAAVSSSTPCCARPAVSAAARARLSRPAPAPERACPAAP
jgi:hypothetical protein